MRDDDAQSRSRVARACIVQRVRKKSGKQPESRRDNENPRIRLSVHARIGISVWYSLLDEKKKESKKRVSVCMIYDTIDDAVCVC